LAPQARRRITPLDGDRPPGDLTRQKICAAIAGDHHGRMVPTSGSASATFFFITDTRATDRTASGWVPVTGARSASQPVAGLSYVQAPPRTP
jgi:hypothetical protein